VTVPTVGPAAVPARDGPASAWRRGAYDGPVSSSYPLVAGLLALVRRPATLRRAALASVVANVGLVVTGGAVRLTGSGLGCPTWPRCTSGSYVTTPAMGAHGVIEFGNRTLSFVVGALAAACLAAALAQRPRRRDRVTLAALLLAGIPAQAVLGGITVLTRLNPWVVGGHFLLSIAVIAAAYQLWVRAGEPAAAPPRAVTALRPLAWLVTVVSGLVLAVGTVVTGSGPHAGDAQARRTGLDPGAVSQLHSDLVFALLGLSVGLWFALRAAPVPAGAARTAGRSAAWLVALELGQGVVGFVQYFTHLPALAVGLHMLGAALVWVATLAVLNVTAGARPSVTRPAPAGHAARRAARTPATSATTPTAASATNGAR
jgi:heme a synthase